MAEPSRGFGYWLNIFANLAVVGGIVFLGLELRQNSQMMRAQTRNEIAQGVREMLDYERQPGTREALERAWEGGVTGDEYYLDNFTRAMLRHWENIHYQYRTGLFDETEFGAEVVLWDRVMEQEFVAEFWDSYRMEYSEGFRDVIDSLIANH